MKGKSYNHIVFTIDNFDSKEELYIAVAKQLQLLLDGGYITVVRLDETDIVVIEFEHDENFGAWGCANPVWITQEEEFYLENRDECEK